MKSAFRFALFLFAVSVGTVAFGATGILGSVPSSPRPPQGGKVTPPHIVKKVEPVYPREAREKGIEGTVELHAILAKDGTVKKLDIISGPPIFTQAALDAAGQWQYSQTVLNGEPVEVDTKITVDFRLKKKTPHLR
jgi:TonB family protein